MTVDLRMFDVGLGNAVFLELDRGFDMVRILADGGDGVAGEEVERTLADLWPSRGSRPTIDLVIGTHYDADHLDGLTVLFEQDRIEVSELWLPPVLDDTDERENGRELDREASLVRRFGGSEGGAAFLRYVDAKRGVLALLDELEGEVPQDRAEPASENQADAMRDGRPPSEERSFFEGEVRSALTVLGDRGGEHDRRFDAASGVDEALPYGWPLDLLHGYGRDEVRRGLREERQATLGRSPSPIRMALARWRLAAATDGINACSLRSLLLALPDPAPRVRQWWCGDDRALIFGWDPSSRTFDQGHPDASTRITLLGPTERLVGERRDKLPRFTTRFVAKRWDRLEGLSDSNQLSYVVRIDHDGQGILLTGDSGFDGFAVGADRRNVYEPKLLCHLTNLDVVQVPHHGGINRHFYRALDAAGFSSNVERVSRLLLSHEPNSRHRPNGAFADYMRRLPEGRVKLFFTGRPAGENIEGYERRISGPEPIGADNGGEIRLVFDGEWKIKAHGLAC